MRRAYVKSCSLETPVIYELVKAVVVPSVPDVDLPALSNTEQLAAVPAEPQTVAGLVHLYTLHHLLRPCRYQVDVAKPG